MKTYYVYILKCSDNTYYTGFTNDIDKRFTEHQSGYAPTSYTHRPVQLVFVEAFIDPKNAIEFEKRVKAWSRKKKEALITQNWIKLKKSSICNNETTHKNYLKE